MTEAATSIKFDLRERLPAILDAINKKKIQIFSAPMTVPCRYSGPCVVGAALTEEERQVIATNKLDKIGVLGLINDGFLEPANDRQKEALRVMQRMHDTGCAYPLDSAERTAIAGMLVQYIRDLNVEYKCRLNGTRK